MSTSSTSSARRTSGPVLRSLSPSGRASSPIIFNRSSTPTGVNLIGSVSFSVPASPSRKTCLCAPSTHPGSFKCKLHRKAALSSNPSSERSNSSVSNRLNARRSAMTNSLVRIGSVEGGEWVKRALSALICPSSHLQRRRGDFQPRPSRLSNMSLGS